jgi:hypothetical protein
MEKGGHYWPKSIIGSPALSLYDNLVSSLVSVRFRPRVHDLINISHFCFLSVSCLDVSYRYTTY